MASEEQTTPSVTPTSTEAEPSSPAGATAEAAPAKAKPAEKAPAKAADAEGKKPAAEKKAAAGAGEKKVSTGEKKPVEKKAAAAGDKKPAAKPAAGGAKATAVKNSRIYVGSPSRLGRPLVETKPKKKRDRLIFTIIEELCIGCGLCADECPPKVNAILPRDVEAVLEGGETYWIDLQRCISCTLCFTAGTCPTDAVVMTEGGVSRRQYIEELDHFELPKATLVTDPQNVPVIPLVE